MIDPRRGSLLTSNVDETFSSMIQPELCTNFEMSITNRVNAGKSAPKPWNSDSNSGIT